jgi:hypothetical protein
MRTVLAVVVVLAAVPALAQEGAPLVTAPASSQCDRPSLEGMVAVDLAGGATSRGFLHCISKDELVLLRNGALQRTPLTDVVKIRRPADPIWDGAAIGAGIAFAMFATWADAGFVLRQAIVFGAIGAGADALHTDARTLWVAPTMKRPTLNVTVRW